MSEWLQMATSRKQRAAAVYMHWHHLEASLMDPVQGFGFRDWQTSWPRALRVPACLSVTKMDALALAG